MADATTWQQIIEEASALVKAHADPRQGSIALSPEVAAFFNAPAGQASKPPAQPDPAPADVESTPPAGAVPPPDAPPAKPAPTARDVAGALEAMAAEVAQCTKCGLCKTRTQTVFGVGNPHAQLVFVGEAPGEEEDRRGEPFVGRAGKLLTDIIEKGMKKQRGDVYICNVLKCRPPGNRNPSPDEAHHCEPYLLAQLDLIRPKAICALGAVAAQNLLKRKAPVGSLRGHWHEFHGIPLRVTYHPSYVIRQQGPALRTAKGKVWEDIQAVMALLDGTDSPGG